MRTQKKARSFFCLALAVLLLCALQIPAFAEQMYPENIQLDVNETEPVTVKILNIEYENNVYISMRDLAAALADTDKAFNITASAAEIDIDRGQTYKEIGIENIGFNGVQITDYTSGGIYGILKRTPMAIDGNEARYYSILYSVGSQYDVYMNVADAAMILDVSMDWASDNYLALNTAQPYVFDMQVLEDQGYFENVSSALTGDVTTGEVYYALNADLPVAIASTTKLMTYVIIMDAIAAGEITAEDEVQIGRAAAELSYNQDYQIHLTEGQTTNVQDLLKAMLITSSNECACALAEYVGGDESTFVERMNDKALQLGMTETTFRNASGLPSYLRTETNSKLQNRMSANDMFTLVAYIMNTYPQITDITSLTWAQLDSLNTAVYNTNPLLYNMQGVTGLKTGTTSQAGSCLVAIKPVRGNENAETHTLITIEFGAETGADRNQKSEILMRYAEQQFFSGYTAEGLPQTAAGFVDTIKGAALRAAQTARADSPENTK